MEHAHASQYSAGILKHVWGNLDTTPLLSGKKAEMEKEKGAKRQEIIRRLQERLDCNFVYRLIYLQYICLIETYMAQGETSTKEQVHVYSSVKLTVFLTLVHYVCAFGAKRETSDQPRIQQQRKSLQEAHRTMSPPVSGTTGSIAWSIINIYCMSHV